MSHPNPAHDPENVRTDDNVRSPKARALAKRIKVQSAQHGTRHLHHREGKMVEAPITKLKRLTSKENIRVK